jgi:hypothetical protein
VEDLAATSFATISRAFTHTTDFFFDPGAVLGGIRRRER